MAPLWADLSQRLNLVPGKEVLQRFRDRVSELYSVSATEAKIIDAMRLDEIADAMKGFLRQLEQFRTQTVQFGCAFKRALPHVKLRASRRYSAPATKEAAVYEIWGYRSPNRFPNTAPRHRGGPWAREGDRTRAEKPADRCRE